MPDDEHASALKVVSRRYGALQLMVTSVRQAVEDARAAGVPWAAIGDVFGVSADEAECMFGGDADR